MKIIKEITTKQYIYDDICDENAKCSCIIEEIQQYIYKDEEDKLSHSKAMEIYGFEDIGQVKTNLGDIYHPNLVWFGSYVKHIRQ